MIGFLVTFWKPIAFILLVATLSVAVGVAKDSYDERRRDEGRAEIQSKWDADIQVRIKRTAQIEQERELDAQKAAKQKDNDDRVRKSLFATVASLSARLSDRDRAVPVPAAAVGVLNDAVRASNADTSAAPGKPVKEATSATGDSNVGAVVNWGVACAFQYASCRDQVGGLIDFYNNLREVKQ